MTAVAVETTASLSTMCFASNKRAFKRIYRASRQAWKNNAVNPLAAYYKESDDALNMGDVGFGVEIEFNIGAEGRGRIDNSVHDSNAGRLGSGGSGCGYDCICHYATNDVSRTLHSMGFIDNPYVDGYHNGEGEYDIWRYESDSTVTGGEVITPILTDNAQGWGSLRQVFEVLRAEGGTVTEENVGGHISVSMDPDADYNLAVDKAYLLIRKFEDVMYRLATNPYRNRGTSRATRHRGQSYAPRMASSIMGGWNPILDRDAWLNIDTYADRFEFRIFDGSLDESVTQTYVLIATAIARILNDDEYVIPEDVEFGIDRPFGWHVSQRRDAGFQARTALSGDAWEKDTQGIREFVDLLFDNDQDKERVITLFAMSDWSI